MSYVKVVECEQPKDCINLECRHRGMHDHGDDCNPCGLKCERVKWGRRSNGSA